MLTYCFEGFLDGLKKSYGAKKNAGNTYSLIGLLYRLRNRI